MSLNRRKTREFLIILGIVLVTIISIIQFGCDKKSKPSALDTSDSLIIMPKTPYNPYPPDGATCIGQHVSLSWNCDNSDSSILRYDVYLGIDTLYPLTRPDTVKRVNPTWGRQSLAMKTLVQIYQMQKAYHNKYPEYCLNGVVANHYGQCFRQLLGVEIDTTDRYDYTICAAINSFTCTATANLDNDRDVDTWRIDQTGSLRHEVRDIKVDFQPGVTYSWRVTAFDTLGVKIISPIWHFTTGPDSIQPNCIAPIPQCPSPPDNGFDVACSTGFYWYCSNPLGDSLIYDLYFGLGDDLHLLARNLPSNEAFPDWAKHWNINRVLRNIYYQEEYCKRHYGCYISNGDKASNSDYRYSNVAGYRVPLIDVYEYSMIATCSTFACTAIADIDRDPTNDIWTVDQSGDIRNISNDSDIPFIQGRLYSWKVVAHTVGGIRYEGPVWHFTAIPSEIDIP